MKLIQLFILFIFLSGCKPNQNNYRYIENQTSLKVMTYNIRLDVASDGDKAWPNRKEFLSSQVSFLGPDVMGIQEALPHQIKDLNKLLQDYKFIGHGRDGGNNGEYSAIYYNSKKIKVETNGTFWLSPKPNQISVGWDAALPRICTYGLFSQQNNQSKFWVFNTHFDHVGVEARKESVKLILNKISILNKQKYPVIVMGDFNEEPNSEVIKEISQTMLDSKQIAKLKFGENGTFNGFKYNEPVSRRIDYIFVSKELKSNVQKYSVLSNVIDFKFPSDHFPVYTELILN